MRKISKIIITFLLFVIGKYGERIFSFLYTLFTYVPKDVFITICILIASLYLIYLDNRK